MPLFVGPQRIAKLYRGATPIARAYRGSTPMFFSAAGGCTPHPIGSESNANEPSGATAWNDFTYIDRSWAIDNGYCVTHIGVYSISARNPVRVKLVERTGAGNYTIHVNEEFSHPGGGWHDHALAGSFPVPGTGGFHASCHLNFTEPGVQASVARSYKAGSIGTGEQTGFTEDNGIMPAMRVIYFS